MLPSPLPSESPANQSPVDALDAETCCGLRDNSYNATLIKRIDIHDDLFRIRVRPDAGIRPFEPGQYVAVGMGNWEPRIRPSQVEDLEPKKWTKVVRRAYSISCPMIGDNGELAPCETLDYLEFYIALVRHASDPAGKPPALTPRMFGINEGDRLVVESKITGHYTLNGISSGDTVLMLSTGTGEAPHNAMTAHLLARGHHGRIINATTVRSHVDLGYKREHQQLMDRFPQYCYLAMTTRDPENLDPSHPRYVGKQYLQDMFTSGQLAEMSGDPLDPANTHVFLCGNPAMIGLVKAGDSTPTRPGMLPLLTTAGFTNEVAGPGHVRFEKYW